MGFNLLPCIILVKILVGGNVQKAVDYYNTGVVLEKRQDFKLAAQMYEMAIEADNSMAEAYINLGNYYSNLRNEESGIGWEYYQKGLQYAKSNDSLARLYNNMGRYIHFRAGKQVSEIVRAIQYYDTSLKYARNDTCMLYNMGSALYAISRYREALEMFLQVLRLEPTHAGANIDTGAIYFLNGDVATGIYYQDQVIKYGTTKYDVLGAYGNKGQFLRDAGHVLEALQTHEAALQLFPDHTLSMVHAFNSRRQLCIWKDLEVYREQLMQAILKQLNTNITSSLQPYETTLMNVPQRFVTRVTKSNALIWKVAGNIEDHVIQHQRQTSLSKRQRVQRTRKLRVGYLSYDFRNHPMGQLTIGALERHNRSNIHVAGYSYGPDDQSELRKRAITACDLFCDVRTKSDIQASSQIYTDSTDILVDLMAHTRGGRVGISALKPSSIIVNYLGYPGTMASAFTNYLIADAFVLPPEKSPAKLEYAEKIVYIPNVYQVNDYPIGLPSKMNISRLAYDQLKAQLAPELVLATEKLHNPIIFCNFNTINKMEPMVFALWMKILHRVPNSIIWLLQPYGILFGQVKSTLLAEANARGIHEGRIAFAPRLEKELHMQRLVFADVFLDTIIYNAHTTAGDMLWMHLPIVTLAGDRFPARVASRFLSLLRLQMLVAYSLKEYENIAVSIATNKKLRNAVVHQLSVESLRSPVFQTERTTQHLERAYQAIWETSCQGECAGKFHICITEHASSFTATKAYFKRKLQELARSSPLAATMGYMRLLQIMPNDSHMWQLLGLSHFRQRNYESALKAFEKALSYSFSNTTYHENVAIAAANLGDLDRASRGFHEAMQSENLNIEFYLEYLRCMEKLNIFSEMEAAFNMYFKRMMIVATKAQLSKILIKQSFALGKLGRLNDAIEFISNVVLVQFPDLAVAKYNLGALYQESNNHEMASKTFMSAALTESKNSYQIYRATQQRIIPSNLGPLIVIYCHEYGQTWWTNWGPSSVKTGLGGSEESVVYLSRNLASRGYEVQVYANPPLDDIGIDEYGVAWYPHVAYDANASVDIFVAWRYQASLGLCGQNTHSCYLWLHDLLQVEWVTVDTVAMVNAIFCVSNFHITTLPPIAQEKVLVAPNGLDSNSFVDGKNQNNVFVYGAAPNRGLYTILTVWAKIRQHIPTAILRIYYGFTESFVSYAKSVMPSYTAWRSAMDRMILQDGIEYHGMVSHLELSKAYSDAGFYLYPSSFPETGSVSLKKALAMGAIPITSRFAKSAIPEITDRFDLGPRPLRTFVENDIEWVELWIQSIIVAVKQDLVQHRSEMKAWARKEFSWKSVATTWSEAFRSNRQSRSSNSE